MNNVIERLCTQYEMILLMVGLSIMIKLYKYFSAESTEHTPKAFFNTVWRELLSDVIIVLALMIIDIYVIGISPKVMLIGVVLSDTILSWFIDNQSSVTNRIMKKLLDLIIDELKIKSNSIDNGEEVNDEDEVSDE